MSESTLSGGTDPAPPNDDLPRKSGSHRHYLIGLVIVSVIGAILAYRWKQLGFQWDEFAHTLKDVHPGWALAAAVLALLTYLGRALRWQVLLQPVKRNSSLWGITSATVIGFTALVFFGRAGELVRPYLIAQKEDVPFSSQIGAWLLERIYDLLTALLIFGFALSQLDPAREGLGQAMQWVLNVGGYVAGVLGVLSLSVLVALTRFSPATKTRLLDALSFLPDSPREKVGQTLEAFSTGMESTRKSTFVYKLAFYSLLEWALIVGSFICLFQAVPQTASLTLIDVFVFVGFGAFGAAVQLPGIGGGPQVVTVVILTELYGLSLGVSSGFALLAWVTTFVVVVPFGVALAFHDGLNWRKRKRIEKGPEYDLSIL